MPGYRYGALLPPLSLNLLVRDTAASCEFYVAVFGADVHYRDIDFAALRVGPAEVMLHADHTHESHPWHAALTSGATRGIGAQIRILGIDPDETQRRAIAARATVAVPPADRGHGWREVCVRDPDGYEWAVGVLIPPATDTLGSGDP